MKHATVKNIFLKLKNQEVHKDFFTVVVFPGVNHQKVIKRSKPHDSQAAGDGKEKKVSLFQEEHFNRTSQKGSGQFSTCTVRVYYFLIDDGFPRLRRRTNSRLVCKIALCLVVQA